VRRKIEKLVRRMAPEYGLDPKLVLAVVQIESGFDSKARSPKNAQGLMQLIPETAERFGVRDTMDPEQNLRGGMSYLRWLLAFFSSDLQLALAGYNAGERAVEKYRGVPAYPETQDYVARIIHLYGSSSHPPVAPVVKPSDVLASLAVR
jgi:soluble lytic murein transglycosylase-like protein